MTLLKITSTFMVMLTISLCSVAEATSKGCSPTVCPLFFFISFTPSYMFSIQKIRCSDCILTGGKRIILVENTEIHGIKVKLLLKCILPNIFTKEGHLFKSLVKEGSVWWNETILNIEYLSATVPAVLLISSA